MLRTLGAIFRYGWKAIGYWVLLLGYLYAPADTTDIFETYPKIKELADMFDRGFLLYGLVIAAGLWITWIDIRPFVVRWIIKRRTPVFSLIDGIRDECYWIKNASDIYIHKYYVCIGNNFPDGRTIKRVQARILGYPEQVLCNIKGSSKSEIDLRHGETALFEIGRMASKEVGMMMGSLDSDEESIKMYNHNLPQGYLSYEVWSFSGKRAFMVSSGSDDGVAGTKSTWEFTIVISADEVKSETFLMKLDFTKEKPEFTLDRTN